MIGKLDQKIRIERQVRTADGAGGQSLAWKPLDVDPEPWAKVKLTGGDEGELGEARQARQRATFTIRARPDIRTADRIRWGGFVWDIKAKGAPVARAAYQELHATSGSLST